MKPKSQKITHGGRFESRPETTKFLFVLTPAQREKLGSLGGSAWLRGQIDKAEIKQPAESVSYQITRYEE